MSKHRRPRATVTADSRTTDPASQSPDSTTHDHLAVDTQTRTEDPTSAQTTASGAAHTRRQQRALDRAKARADKAYARDRAALAAARAEAGRPEIDYDTDTTTEPKMVGYEITLWRLNPLATDATDNTDEPTQAHESAMDAAAADEAGVDENSGESEVPQAEASPDEDSDTDAAPEAGSTAVPETTLPPHPEAHEPIVTYADLYEGPVPHTTDAAGDVQSTPHIHGTHVAEVTDDSEDSDGDGTTLTTADHPLHLDTHLSRARARQARLDARAQARAQAAAAAILARREKQAAKALARIERAEKKQGATPTRTPAHPAGETPAPLADTDVPEVEDTQAETIQVEAPVVSVETDNPDAAYTVTHTQRTHTVPTTTTTPPDHTTAPTEDRTALPAADRGIDRAAARAAAKAAKAAARTERLAAKAAAREAARAARAEKKAARAAAKAAARQARADAKAARKNKTRAGLTNPFAQRANDYDQFATGLSTAAVSGFTTPRPGEAITPDLPPLAVDDMLASFDTAANSGAYTGAPDELGFTDADTWTGHDTDPHHTGGVINQATWTPPPVPGLDTLHGTDGINPETGQPFDLITRVEDHPDYDPTFDAAAHLAHTHNTDDTDGTVQAGDTYGHEFALTTNITTELHDPTDNHDDTTDADTDEQPEEPAPTPLATITSTITATSRRGRRKTDIEAELAARQSDYDAMFSATPAPGAPAETPAAGAPAPLAHAAAAAAPTAPATPSTLRDALNNPRTLPTHLKQHPRHLAAAAATALALLGLTGYLLTAPAADQATATSATIPTTTSPASPVDTPLLIDLDQDNTADTTLTTTAPDGTTLDINIPDTTRDRALITTALPPTQDTTPSTGAGTPATTRTLATALVPATDPWWLTIRNMATDLTTWSNNTPGAAPRKTRWYALTTSPRTNNHPAYNHLHIGFTTAEAAQKYADKTNPEHATTTIRGTVLTLTNPDTTAYNPTWTDPTPDQAQALDNLKPTVGTWTINYGHAVADTTYRTSTLLSTLGYGPGTIWTAIADNPTSPWIGNLTAHTPPHKGATLDTALTGQETVLTNLLTASGYTTKNDTLGNLPAPTLDEGPDGTVLAYALAAATTPWDLTSDTLAGTQGTNPTGAPSRIWVTNNGTQVIDTP